MEVLPDNRAFEEFKGVGCPILGFLSGIRVLAVQARGLRIILRPEMSRVPEFVEARVQRYGVVSEHMQLRVEDVKFVADVLELLVYLRMFFSELLVLLLVVRV